MNAALPCAVPVALTAVALSRVGPVGTVLAYSALRYSYFYCRCRSRPRSHLSLTALSPFKHYSTSFYGNQSCFISSFDPMADAPATVARVRREPRDTRGRESSRPRHDPPRTKRRPTNSSWVAHPPCARGRLPRIISSRARNRPPAQRGRRVEAAEPSVPLQPSQLLVRCDAIPISPTP